MSTTPNITTEAAQAPPAREFFTTRDLATRLGVHPVTLANWRVKGKGPRFVKMVGRVRYPVAQVEQWEQDNLRQNTAIG